MIAYSPGLLKQVLRSISACRPFDAAKQTNTSGGWEWVNMPQSTLLNGHGYYGDCAMLAGSNTAVAPKCNVTLQWVPPGRSSVLPYNSPSNPGVHVQPCCGMKA